MTRIDHIGIAVEDLEAASELYTDGLGLTLAEIETVEEQGVRVGFVSLGESHIELLEPVSSDGSVAKFLGRRGEGVHHVCIQVDDIVSAMARLREQGAQLLTEEPSLGARGRLVAFVHPRSANGVLLELSQPI